MVEVTCASASPTDLNVRLPLSIGIATAVRQRFLAGSCGVGYFRADFTATGPLDNSIYQERYDGYDGCRNTLLSSSRGRTADATFTFLGSTYRTTGRVGENVQWPASADRPPKRRPAQRSQ
jgi:hypothetical protein